MFLTESGTPQETDRRCDCGAPIFELPFTHTTDDGVELVTKVPICPDCREVRR